MAIIALAFPAAAQDWPTKPVKLIVPFPAGGGTDLVGRLIAQGLSEGLGQPVVVDNRGGAGGTIGSDAVAKAAPDGYTLGVATSSTHPASVVLQKGVPYDPVTSFQPVTMIGTTPYMLVVSPDAPAATLGELIAYARAHPGELNYASVGVTTLGELIAYARAHPGELNYASVGVTTLGYLLTEQLKIITETSLVHIPYKGSGQVYPDLIANRVSLLLDNPTGSAGFVKSRQLRALATTERSQVLPEVPLFSELGVAGFDAVFWYGLVAPRGTPRPIVDRIQREVARYVRSATGSAELASKDVRGIGDTPEALGATIAADITRWRALADRLGIQPE